MLKFLWGMFAGYMVCVIELSIILFKKGYTNVNEIKDKHSKNN